VALQPNGDWDALGDSIAATHAGSRAETMVDLWFLPHDGELGRLIRAHAWEAGPLGNAASWPMSLKTLVGVMLASRQPMFVIWGAGRVWLYNDAFAPILGRKHPAALGQPADLVWLEAWPHIRPMIDRVFAGEAVSMDDIELMLDRHGFLEETHFTFSYTPVHSAQGGVEGLFGTCFDTTATVLADRRRASALRRERQLFEQAPGFIAVLQGPQHVFEFVNAAYVRLVGDRELLGRTVREAFPEGHGQSFYDWLDGVYATGQRYVASRVPVSLRTAPDRPPENLVLDFIYEPITDESGAVTGIFVEGHDVTSEARAHHELRENERRQALLVRLGDRFRDLEAPADLSYAAAELLGTALEVSRAGYGTIDLVAETIVIEREWLAHGVAPLPRMLKFREHGTYIDELRRGETVVCVDADADPRTAATADALHRLDACSFVNMPVMEQNGLVALLYLTQGTVREWRAEEVAFIREVAERTRTAVQRRRAEHELQALAASLEQQVTQRTAERDRVWRNSRDLLVVLGANGIFRAVNPAWTTILGHDPSEVVGRSFREFVWPDDTDMTQSGLEDAAAQRDLTNFENRYRHKDGTPRWISWHTSVEGGLVYAYGRHVTEEKAQQDALHEAEAQLRQSQKMEAVGQLTGGLAHDFNNLLTGITGSLEMVTTRLAQGRIDELERYVAAAQGAARRAAALTHRLLAFSRRQTLDPKSVNINRLISGIEELVRRTVGPAIQLEVVGTAGLWTTFADLNQLENALLNLCINARDAMPDGGRLTIETANRWLDARAARERELPPGQYVSLCVSDTGTGMAPDVIAHAFDPFYTTKPLGMGTGLGLSMIYGFAKQSGGQVRIYSEYGQGTMVCIYLPRHLGDEAADDPMPSAPPAMQARQGETVLVVDDEPTIRMLVTDVLDEFGYHAIEAGDGAAAMKVLESTARIDLLVTDVGLPGGMNGRQVADAARTLRPGLKVLFVTGYAENAVVGGGHLEPGMQVLTKPFAMDDLATRIRELITGGAQSLPSP
jgi:PAS domain S-box-containing protein